MLYPFILEPKTVSLIWGGDALARRFGKPGDPQASIGESWECWDENRIVNGTYAGVTLAALRAELGEALMGSLDSSRMFPLLTKFIDARQTLSVQVHPDDAYAQRVEGQPWGKTECWYVLEAQANAEVVLGWNRDISREEFYSYVGAGTLGELLRRVPARTGDVFFLPAGTLHAIGAGIILFEVQQAGDLTYRIFDWNRLGSDGKPRTLHVEKAADVLDYSRARASNARTLTYLEEGVERTLLAADSHFVLERAACDAQAFQVEMHGMPLIVQALQTSLEIRASGSEALVLQPYASALLPAALEGVRIASAGGTGSALLVTPGVSRALSQRLERAGVSSGKLEAFSEQFA